MNPGPSLDLAGETMPAAFPRRVDVRREEDRRLLERIQGNLIQPHGWPCTTLWLFRFPAGWRAARCRDYLRRIAGNVTSAADICRPRAAQRGAPVAAIPAFLGFGLTSSGIRRAGVSNPEVHHTPNRDFTRGMAAIDAVNGINPGIEFGDPIDAEGRPTEWEPAYLGDFDGVWVVGHAAGADWSAALAPVAAGLVEVKHETGMTRGHEPFGFRDGLTRHAFFRGEKASSYWADLELRSVLIDAATPHREGSFLVFRKLEQNVRAFREFEAVLRRSLPARRYEGGDPGALLIGRHRDGTPLGGQPAGRHGDFTFMGDKQGRGCPFHAHIRKANPRGTLPREWQNTRDTQFVRRSVIYDSTGQLDRSGPPYPQNGVGMLFLGYMSEIGRQFMAMHKSWMMQAQFPKVTGTPHGLDPLLFGGREGPAWNWKQGDRATEVRGLASFVTARGGAYFYLPAKTWLADPA